MATNPTSTDPGLEATSTALQNLTDTAANDHSADPKKHIHAPAHAEHAHAWLSKVPPSSQVENLEARFHLGNYVIERHTGQRSFEPMSVYVRLGMHLLYYGAAQERLLEAGRVKALLAAQSERMGKEYDAPESKAHIAPFIQSFQLADTLDQLVEPDPAKYATFNDFFARAIKPEARPVDSPGDARVVSSPADCRLTAFPAVDEATRFWIKGQGFTLERLFDDADLANQFDGGSVVVARLAPQDYHRWHAPVSGVVRSVKEIPGAYYTVNPQAINEPGVLDVFCENRRSVMVLDAEPGQVPVVIVAVGAMLVGSIAYVDGAGVPGTKIQRGQCMGKFLYGGSTVVVVFPKGAVELDQDLVGNSTAEKPCETLMRVGWRVGVRR